MWMIVVTKEQRLMALFVKVMIANALPDPNG